MLLITANLSGQEDAINRIFSLDLGYTRIGLENNGWGLGTGFEHILRDHMALKYGFGHMTFKTNVDDLYCTTVNISIMSNYYFLNSDLRDLYFGMGMATDFLNYFGSGTVPDQTGDTIIYLDSLLGWKYYFHPALMLDLGTGYNWILSNAEYYPSFARYGKGGFFYSIALKIFFSGSGKS